MGAITYPSFCIPRSTVFDYKFILQSFQSIFGIKTIDRIDIVPYSQQLDTFRIFVHFNYWPNDPTSIAIRKRLLDGETVKIVYDTPWLWKCAASRYPKPDWSIPKSIPYEDKKYELTHESQNCVPMI